jgi:hypothetical protein
MIAEMADAAGRDVIPKSVSAKMVEVRLRLGRGP